MTIPAGWYDDGSGARRWWDGSAWTEHTVTAPPVAQPVPAPAAPTASRDQAPPAGIVGAYGGESFTPPYVFAGQASDRAAVGGYPVARDADASPARKTSVLGIIGLSVTALGAILSCIPPASLIGWLLLALGFIASLVSIFLPGAKWPGISGMALGVLGAVLAVAVVLLTLGAPDAVPPSDDAGPAATPGPQPSDDPSPAPSPVEGTESVTFAELEVGQCIPFMEWEEEIYELPIVPCDQPHTDEVYLIFEVPDGDFPGDDQLQSVATERCESAFGEFVGIPYADSVLDMYWFVPTQASWNRMDDRAIQCIAFSYDEVTGTLEGAAR